MSAHLTRTTMIKRRSVEKRGCRVGYAGRFMPVSVLRRASAAVVGEHSAMGHMGGLPKASALFVSGATTAAQTLSFQIRTLPTAAVACHGNTTTVAQAGTRFDPGGHLSTRVCYKRGGQQSRLIYFAELSWRPAGKGHRDEDPQTTPRRCLFRS